MAGSDAAGTGAAAGVAAGAAAGAAGEDQEGGDEDPAPLAEVLFGTPAPAPPASGAAEAVANVAGAFATQVALATEGDVVTDPANAEAAPSPTLPSAGPDPLATLPGEAKLGAATEGCTGGFLDMFSGCAEEEHAAALDCSGTFLKTMGLPFDSCGGGSTAYFCIELGAGCLGGVFESHCDPTEVPGKPLTYPCSNHTAPLVEVPIVGTEAGEGHSGVPFPKGRGPDDNGLKKWFPNGGGVGIVPDLANYDDPKAQEYLLFYGLKSITKGRWTAGPSLLGALSWEEVDRGDNGVQGAAFAHHEVEEEPVYSSGFTFDVGTHFEIGKRRFGIEVGALAYLSGVWAPEPAMSGGYWGWPATVPAPVPVTPSAIPAQAPTTPTATATATATPVPMNPTPADVPDRLTPSPSPAPELGATPVAATPEPGSQPAIVPPTASPAGAAPVAPAPAGETPAGTAPEEPVAAPESEPEVLLLDPVTHLVVGTCDDGACGLNRRVAPSTDADVVGVSLDGDPLEVVCQTTGEKISNGHAESAIWNRLSDGTWVSDFYVDTPNVGTFSYPAC